MHNRAQKGGDEELHQKRPWHDLGNALPVFWLYAQNLQCTWIRPWYNLGTTLVRPWNDLSKAWTQATPSIGTAPRLVKKLPGLCMPWGSHPKSYQVHEFLIPSLSGFARFRVPHPVHYRYFAGLDIILILLGSI